MAKVPADKFVYKSVSEEDGRPAASAAGVTCSGTNLPSLSERIVEYIVINVVCVGMDGNMNITERMC